jgi:hypothetical protein
MTTPSTNQKKEQCSWQMLIVEAQGIRGIVPVNSATMQHLPPFWPEQSGAYFPRTAGGPYQTFTAGELQMPEAFCWSAITLKIRT